MDPITVIVAFVPEPWSLYLLAVIGACSIADALVPQVDPGSRWGIPRAALHLVGMNFDKAARALKKGDDA